LIRRIHLLAVLVAACGVLAAPGIAQAGPGKSCVKKPFVNKAFVVKGTLSDFEADTSADPGYQGSVEITVTRANRHARRSGVDAGDSFTADTSTDAFRLAISGGTTPDSGDKVRIVGKVAVERKKCAPEKTLAERYGDVNIRRVKIIDD
jgi:hypothetical protein